MGTLTRPVIYWQYNNSPKLRNLLLNIYAEFKNSFPCAVWEELDIDTAKKYALDLIGQRMGIPRPLEVPNTVGIYDVAEYETAYYDRSLADLGYVGDDIYRLILKIRAIQKYQTTTISNLYALLSTLFPGKQFKIEVDFAIHKITLYCNTYMEYPERYVLLNNIIILPEGFSLVVINNY